METAPARERKLEATSDLVHGDERNRESLELLDHLVDLLDELNFALDDGLDLERLESVFQLNSCESRPPFSVSI